MQVHSLSLKTFGGNGMHSDTRALSALSSLYGLQRYSCDFFNTAAVALTEGEAKRENHKASITR